MLARIFNKFILLKSLIKLWSVGILGSAFRSIVVRSECYLFRTHRVGTPELIVNFLF